MNDPNKFASEAVSLEDGRKAREALRDRGRDIDGFLNNLDVTTLLEGPVGPTAECLTLDQLEAYAFNPLTELPHLAHCTSCTNTLRAYRTIKQRPLEAPFRPIEIEVPAMIGLVPASLQFDLTLQCDSALDLMPADIKVANAAFGDIHCETIDMVNSNPETGWTYRAVCVARPNDQLFADFAPGAEFVDWIEVSGTNTAGQRFAASDLARFSIRPKTFTGI